MSFENLCPVCKGQLGDDEQTKPRRTGSHRPRKRNGRKSLQENHEIGCSSHGDLAQASYLGENR